MHGFSYAQQSAKARREESLITSSASNDTLRSLLRTLPTQVSITCCTLTVRLCACHVYILVA